MVGGLRENSITPQAFGLTVKHEIWTIYSKRPSDLALMILWLYELVLSYFYLKFSASIIKVTVGCSENIPLKQVKLNRGVIDNISSSCNICCTSMSSLLVPTALRSAHFTGRKGGLAVHNPPNIMQLMNDRGKFQNRLQNFRLPLS